MCYRPVPDVFKPYRLAERIKRLLETAGVGFFGLGQGLEPVGDFVKAFFARGLSHSRVHIGVLVGFAGDRGLEVLSSLADGITGSRIADRLEVFEMAESVSGFAFCGLAKQRRHFVLPFDIGLLREIEIAPIRLALAGEGGLQISFSL